MKKVTLLISLLLLSSNAFADCNFKKAARNKMLDQKIGVSGKCDTQKAVKTETTKKVDDHLGVDSQKIKNDVTEKKEQVDSKVSTVNKAIDHLK